MKFLPNHQVRLKKKSYELTSNKFIKENEIGLVLAYSDTDIVIVLWSHGIEHHFVDQICHLNDLDERFLRKFIRSILEFVS